jgi:hypothetical protein
MNLASVNTISYADSKDGILVLVGLHECIKPEIDYRSWESEINVVYELNYLKPKYPPSWNVIAAIATAVA